MIGDSIRIHKFLRTVLDIADWSENETQNEYFGYGFRAFQRLIRNGVKEILSLEDELSEAKLREKIAIEAEEDIRAFLDDVFGDREIHTICENNKQKLKEFIVREDM